MTFPANLSLALSETKTYWSKWETVAPPTQSLLPTSSAWGPKVQTSTTPKLRNMASLRTKQAPLNSPTSTMVQPQTSNSWRKAEASHVTNRNEIITSPPITQWCKREPASWTAMSPALSCTELNQEKGRLWGRTTRSPANWAILTNKQMATLLWKVQLTVRD